MRVGVGVVANGGVFLVLVVVVVVVDIFFFSGMRAVAGVGGFERIN